MHETINREDFVSKILPAMNFRIKQFTDKRPHTALLLTMHMYFCLFNFHTSQAIRK